MLILLAIVGLCIVGIIVIVCQEEKLTLSTMDDDDEKSGSASKKAIKLSMIKSFTKESAALI